MPSTERIDPASVVQLLQGPIEGLALVYLFGSETDDTTRAASDLDIAFLADTSLAPMERFTAQEDLARALNRDVDLVDLQGASTVMQAQILHTGRLLFERSRIERDRFEMHACSAYALLNEERRGILEDIHRRGRIYGKHDGGADAE